MTRKLLLGTAVAVLILVAFVLISPPGFASAPHEHEQGTPNFLPHVRHFATATATPKPTNNPQNPSPTATRVRVRWTPTPRPTLDLPTPSPNREPDWTDTALFGEQGMSPAVYYKLVADAQSGAFDRACTPAEHDPTKWHTLLNYDANCHYDHQHGDDPFAVSDIFGAPGVAFKAPGWEVAYPWQTFPIADDETDHNVVPEEGVMLENESKHEGYIWIVRRNQTCVGGRYCLTDFRLQMHFHGTNDASTRWHSYSFEGRLCVNASDPSTCGLYRLGGWADFSRLYIPPHESNVHPDCSVSFNGALEGKSDATQYLPYILKLANYDQYYRPESDTPPFDEVRCHKQMSLDTVDYYPNGIERAVEWWGHAPFDFRWQFRLWNPNGNVLADATPGDNFCKENSTTCRWTHSRFTAEIDYVIPVNTRLDSNGDGIADFNGWVNRMGDVISDGCGPTASLNCIWADMRGVRINPGALGYNHDLTANSEPWEYDITPIGQPTWITWFQHYGH